MLPEKRALECFSLFLQNRRHGAANGPARRNQDLRHLALGLETGGGPLNQSCLLSVCRRFFSPQDLIQPKLPAVHVIRVHTWVMDVVAIDRRGGPNLPRVLDDFYGCAQPI